MHPDHSGHTHSPREPQDAAAAATTPSLRRTAFSATVHCLTGCSIGEVLGMVIGTALLLSNNATVVLSVVLVFFFGYALTIRPLLRSGLGLGAAAKLALASDTLSITIREFGDTAS